MSIRQRADLFTRYVGLELKGKITARGRSAKSVAEELRHSPAAFNRWLNGKVELPLAVLYEVCLVIGVDPISIVSAALDRVDTDFTPVAELDVVRPPHTESAPLAAQRGTRKVDVDPAE